MAKGICSVEGCDRVTATRGLCNAHYHRWRARGTFDLAERPLRATCRIDDCGRNSYCRGYCDRHYYRWRKHADAAISKDHVTAPPLEPVTDPSVPAKTCTGCKRRIALKDFGIRTIEQGGRSARCKDCVRIRVRKRYAEDDEFRRARLRYGREDQERNPQRRRTDRVKSRLLHMYGLAFNQYEALVELQHGTCAICHQPPAEGKTRLSVDHDHVTRVVRGLLCDSCNVALGLFYDDVNRMRSAIKYLEREPPTLPPAMPNASPSPVEVMPRVRRRPRHRRFGIQSGTGLW